MQLRSKINAEIAAKLIFILSAMLFANPIYSAENFLAKGVSKPALAKPAFIKNKRNHMATSNAFEAAKRSRPELINFLQDFPKGADLHNHLDGTVFSEHALESAEQKGLNYDLVSNSFTPNQLSDSVISLNDLKSNSVHFRAFRESFSIRAWKQVPGSGYRFKSNIGRRHAQTCCAPRRVAKHSTLRINSASGATRCAN